jgi:hypothetical protein
MKKNLRTENFLQEKVFRAFPQKEGGGSKWFRLPSLLQRRREKPTEDDRVATVETKEFSFEERERSQEV